MVSIVFYLTVQPAFFFFFLSTKSGFFLLFEEPSWKFLWQVLQPMLNSLHVYFDLEERKRNICIIHNIFAALVPYCKQMYSTDR